MKKEEWSDNRMLKKLIKERLEEWIDVWMEGMDGKKMTV